MSINLSKEVKRREEIIFQWKGISTRMQDIARKIQANKIGLQFLPQTTQNPGEEKSFNASDLTIWFQKLISFISSMKSCLSLDRMKIQIAELKDSSEGIQLEAAKLEENVKSLKDTLERMKELIKQQQADNEILEKRLNSRSTFEEKII